MISTQNELLCARKELSGRRAATGAIVTRERPAALNSNVSEVRMCRNKTSGPFMRAAFNLNLSDKVGHCPLALLPPDPSLNNSPMVSDKVRLSFSSADKTL